jgi:hypothetical protein
MQFSVLFTSFTGHALFGSHPFRTACVQRAGGGRDTYYMNTLRVGQRSKRGRPYSSLLLPTIPLFEVCIIPTCLSRFGVFEVSGSLRACRARLKVCHLQLGAYFERRPELETRTFRHLSFGKVIKSTLRGPTPIHPPSRANYPPVCFRPSFRASSSSA